MVTWFDPVSKGIDALQLLVPAAVPDEPVLVFQVTLATATLSIAMPKKLYAAALVETVVPPGDVIVSVGGVVSFVPVGVGVGAGGGVGAGVGVGVGSGAGAGMPPELGCAGADGVLTAPAP